MAVVPPSVDTPVVRVTITGQGQTSSGVTRTITATIGRPAFSEYVMLTDDAINIGGPVTRQWFGKTHSNTQIQMNTYNINDMITCTNASYNGNPGVYSTLASVRDHQNSLQLWDFPVNKVDFGTVTADFGRFKTMATNAGSAYAYVTPATQNGAHGWYIKLGPANTYQVAKVTAESEVYNNNVEGPEWGGYLRYAYTAGQTGSLSPPITYPPNGITIAASGQFNTPSTTADVNVVGDITYAALDGKAAVGLVAQRDIKIPMYAPRGVTGKKQGSNCNTGQIGDCNMTIHAAMIAQTGREYVNRQSTSGPRRGTLTIIGSVSSFLTPSRMEYSTSTGAYGGFGAGVNDYDAFLLRTPPPSFPTVGSFQILDWQELPSTMKLEPVPTS
jgi:hypothetical protein